MNKINLSIIPKDAKVLLQLSGGKDSIACLIFLKENHIECDAIHFTHEYGYPLPTSMAKKACKILGVKINLVDITKEIETTFLNEFNKRPCRYCKGIMDEITINFAIANGYSLICVGDTRDDKMLVNRLIKNERRINSISRYFNPLVSLPNEIQIYRPLLTYSGDDALRLVLSRFPWFQRVNDTGDKYFEYSREGCPLQFKDYGALYTKKLMCDLKHLNMLCGEFASAKGIRASIHLPSEFIVTIPKGYEDECRQYLLAHGAKLQSLPNKRKNHSVYHILIDLELNNSMYDANIISMACNRLIERLSVDGNLVFGDKIGHLKARVATIDVALIGNDRLLVSITSKKVKWQPLFIENVCIEIFHTRKFKVLNYQM